jgi:hypothetical protein
VISRRGALLPQTARSVYVRMGYIIVIAVAILVVPVLFMMLTRRSGGGRGIDSSNHGVTVLKPSSDQPTPPPGPARNKVGPGGDNGVPPG